MLSKEGMNGDSNSGEKIEACPMCGAEVPKDSVECPNCEEPFTPEAYMDGKDSRGGNFLFWVGVIMALGGGGIAMGSWLHDLLELSLVANPNHEVFGWLNRLVALIGIVILVIGIIFLILSLSKMEKQELEDIEDYKKESKKEQGG